jgi:hypothetical protein
MKKGVQINIRNVDPEDWHEFKRLCLNERKTATAKLREMIAETVKEVKK